MPPRRPLSPDELMARIAAEGTGHDVPFPNENLHADEPLRLRQGDAMYKVRDYNECTENIYCFADNKNPASTRIRQHMEELCSKSKYDTTLHSGSLRIPKDIIPQGNWTIGFAPGILWNGAWVLVCAAPKDSESVWYFYPGKGEAESKYDMFALFQQMRDRGETKEHRILELGGPTHRKFHAMIEHLLWTGVGTLTHKIDARTGEFRATVEDRKLEFGVFDYPR